MDEASKKAKKREKILKDRVGGGETEGIRGWPRGPHGVNEYKQIRQMNDKGDVC